MATCANCGRSLGFLGGLKGQRLCKSCSEVAERARTTAEQEYNATLLELISSPAPVADIQSRLPVLAQQAGLSDETRQALHLETCRYYMGHALEDDHLTQQEETRLKDIAEALGIDQDTFNEEFDDLLPQLIVAKVNDGRLPVLSDPKIVLKKGEVAHMSTEAVILKEVAVRQSRHGLWTGPSVVVGYRSEIEDVGLLTVTSQRVVYAGDRKTIEMPFSKLVSLNVVEDSVRFNMSNRKNAPSFEVTSGRGHVIAAIVNAAAQQGEA